MHNLIDLILGIAENLGYTGIFFMMMIESSFIPFPSEVAMIPAGYLVSLGKMNIYLAFFAGTAGACFGASINYFLGKKLGAPVIKKLVKNYGKYIFLSENHYIKSEEYFKKHGSITTLIGRFIPAVRQLISIPAGIFQMSYSKFLFFTVLGAGTWNTILLTIGYIAGQNDQLIRNLTSQITLWLLVGLGTIVMLYIAYVQKQAPKLRKLEEEISHQNEL